MKITERDYAVVAEGSRLNDLGLLTFDTPIVDTRIEFPLYKFGVKQFIQKFLGTGILQIGTLWGYRNNQYEEGITDPAEGILEMMLHMHDGAPLGFNGNCMNCYVYCVSEDDNRKRFASAGYDAAFRINHPAFFSEIAKVIMEQTSIRETTVAKVLYADPEELVPEIRERMHRFRHLPEANRVNNAFPPLDFLKPSHMIQQKEVRARFWPDANYPPHKLPPIMDMDNCHAELGLPPINPLILSVPRALTYVEPVWNCSIP